MALGAPSLAGAKKRDSPQTLLPRASRGRNARALRILTARERLPPGHRVPAPRAPSHENQRLQPFLPHHLIAH